MAIVQGYFDESGDLEVESGVFCLAGYFIAPDAARDMDRDWAAVLDAHKIPHFHMVDCAHGNGAFDGMPVAERAQIVTDLIALIKKYTIVGFAVVAKRDVSDPPNKFDAPNPYSDCAASCVKGLQVFLEMNRISGDIDYCFEEGHKHRRSAFNFIAKKFKRERDSLTFGAKESIRLLQAADLLAWQVCKYAKDYFFARMAGDTPKREPRKDFLSLTEHDHSFFYIGPSKALGIELWPLSKRSQTTVFLSIKEDGPVPYWLHDGDTVPFIPVERTLGSQSGPSKFAYVGFSGFGGKQFALAFDEPRLFEAASVLIEATGELFSQSDYRLVTSAETIEVERVGDARLLTLKLRGAKISIKLTDEVLARLKEIGSSA